ncbi:MAG: hypothetical protein EXS03_00190 [Phycisphaerales bacterium]|nr:hypothetical protein [Phycisphaerales bacterium]
MASAIEMFAPAGSFLADNAVAVHLLSFYKPFLIVLTAAPYAWLISSVIDKDVRYYHLNEKAWNAATVGALILGLATVFFIPLFWVGWPLMVLLYMGVAYGYWKYRDPKVPEGKRFDLFAGKWAAYTAQKRAAKAFGEVTASFADAKGNRQTPPGKDNPLFDVHLACEQLILSALPRRASRIDLAPGPTGHASAMIIDSVRVPRAVVGAELAARMIDYLKSAAGLDTKDRRKKGRAPIRMDVGGGKVNLTLTAWGASAGQFLRLEIERDRQLTRTVDKLGLLPQQVEAITQGLTDVRDGVVLVAAAPGNGLTTLGYTLLSRHDSYTNNIKTLERVVERKLEGVDHLEWDPAEPSADFAGKLQTVVRRGPDIVMSSEITDPGTGEVLVNPNNAGALFYGLIATDSAQAALATYLKAVGDPKAAASRLRLVVSQRLARTLCTECRQPYQATPDQAKRLGVSDGKPLQLFRASGKVQFKNEVVDCSACQGSGFSGATGLFEVLRVDARCAEILAAGDVAGAYTAMRRAFRAPSAQDCGLVKVRSGETSLEEVARVFAPKTAAKAPSTSAKPAAPSTPSSPPRPKNA